jgi:CheY-like chemotaxis protein
MSNPIQGNDSLNVLVVEDNLINQKVFKMLLEAVGNEFKIQKIVIAENGDQALKSLESEDFNLIIMDVGLPGGLSGIDVAKIVKEKYPKILMIVSSAAYELTADEELLFNAVMQKPITLDAMKAKLSEALGVKK